MATPRYVVAAVHTWNRRVFNDVLVHYPGEWLLIDQPQDLTAARLAAIRPRYVFLLHWSWRVPTAVLATAECIGFHMTDLPYGRGGSPLQNLIVRGHRSTMLSAFRMVDEMDAGPIYAKAPLGLDGCAEDIYVRAAGLAATLIAGSAESEPVPTPQTGDVVTFARRTPAESRLPENATPEQAYDFIRMLDATGYPPAFVEHGEWRCEFSHAQLEGDELRADVRLVRPGRAE